ncbi:MAG: molybdate ABC transporter permease subunit [Alphaproteobacteria bacterium]|nr:molybdate ABC transporter permease subunit [Alphaproteobacteria bacterium]
MLAPEDAQILAVSFGVAARAVAWTMPFAIGAAYLLSRPAFPGKSALDGLVHLPLVLPPVLVGFLLLSMLGRRAPIGAWLDSTFGVRLAFTTEGAAIAAGVMAFPLMVRAMRLAFEQTDTRLMAAAAVLGAGPWDRFWSVALPLAAPGVLAGAVTAFAVSLGEFGAVITFAANIPGETQTLPLAIYAALQRPGGDAEAFRLAFYSFGLAIAALIAAEALQRWSRHRLAR